MKRKGDSRNCIFNMNLTKLLLICYTIVPLAVAAAAAWSGCPPDGPLLPRPTNIHNSAIVANATSKLSDLLDKALNGSIESGFSVRNTSFSVGVVSLDSPSGLPFWSYHHRGQGNQGIPLARLSLPSKIHGDQTMAITLQEEASSHRSMTYQFFCIQS